MHHGIRAHNAVLRGARRTNTEADTSDSVDNRANPGQLGLVDGEVGAAGSPESLVVQDVLFSAGCQRLRLYGPIEVQH